MVDTITDSRKQAGYRTAVKLFYDDLIPTASLRVRHPDANTAATSSFSSDPALHFGLHSLTDNFDFPSDGISAYAGLA